MLRKALATATIAGIGAYSGATLAVSDAEFKALQDQLNALADKIDTSATTSPGQTRIGGYGELHYTNLDSISGNREKQLDFHRFVLFINHEFNSSIRLFSEVEIEHSVVAPDTEGEVELEQAYLQFDLGENTQLNAGAFLLPVGILNETHEPTTFYGVERNPVETYIIPSTWWEGGAMLSGHNNSGISYDLAVHSGISVDPADISIRDGRKELSEAPANNLAVTGRVRYTGIAGLELSASLQLQSDITQDRTDNIGDATLIESHAVWSSGPVTVKALFARWNINGSGASALARDVQDGAYLEADYKIAAAHGVFIRQNTWDNGGPGSATRMNQTNIGYSYWPHEDVVVKMDLQAQDRNAGDQDGINVGIGFRF